MKGYVKETGRIQKAKKIITILEESLNKPIRNMTILDIGTGNGEIANYIADKGNDVYSVDVQKLIVDEKVNFHFVKVKNEVLPFKDEQFDIVISNHVIEHMENGICHLNEIHRVLKKGGRCYFATPNRNFPKEVHTNTLFLHWLPYSVFWKCLKDIHRYQEPIRLISHREMRKEFANVGFFYRDWTIQIINNPLKYSMDSKWKVKLPYFFSAIAPTNVFVLTKKENMLCEKI